MDHTLYVTLRTSSVGTVTMDTHRTLEKERRDKLTLLKMVLQSRSLIQLLNIDRTSDRIMTEGVVKSTQRSTSFVITYRLVGVIGIVEFRKRATDDRAVLKHRGSRGSCMQNVHAQKHAVYMIIHCKKILCISLS